MVSKGFPNVITSGRQYNIGEKPSVILYTYIMVVTGKGFVAIRILVGLSSGLLLPWCDPLTFVHLCHHERDWYLIGLSYG